MCHYRNPRHCIVPPYIVENMAKSGDKRARDSALESMKTDSAVRAVRTVLASMPIMAAIPSPGYGKHRLIYDARNGRFEDLPGKLVLEEGGKKSKDPAVNEAYRFSGKTYDFYKKNFNRNSLDDRGMSLISSVRLGRNLNNAFWTGEQMCYGDGDGHTFKRFTRSLDVVGHELTHGVITHTCNLEYSREPGALNEHLADVFGTLVKQWSKKQTVKQADWLIGAELMGPGTGAKSLRTFSAGKAFENDPVLGTDLQPKHYKNKYKGSADNFGVHINSGIPNHAFYLAAMAVGGQAWTRMGRVWYRSMLKLARFSEFVDMVEVTVETATSLFGAGSKEVKAVMAAWKEVGL